MFASRITKDVTLTGDGEGAAVVVTVQKLSGRSLEKAREARSAAQLAGLRNASGELLRFMRGESGPGDATAQAAVEEYARQKAAEAVDPLAQRRVRFAQYDRDHVLNGGIVRWSAQDRDGKPLPVSPATVGDLDEAASEQLFEAILDLSLPALSPEAVEAAEGKGSSLSTGS